MISQRRKARQEKRTPLRTLRLCESAVFLYPRGASLHYTLPDQCPQQSAV